MGSLQRKEQDLISQARNLHKAALHARSGDYDAQTRTSAMKNVIDDLSNSVDRHEESLELGETLFASEKRDRERDDDDLGESSSVDSNSEIPPIQAELNYEHQKMAE